MGRMPAVVYASHLPDAQGRVSYSPEEHAVWQALTRRQREALAGHACDTYLRGLEWLALPEDHIPQTSEVSLRLLAATGWRLEPVPALIDFSTFWRLLAERRFPCATFIRDPSQLEYLQEPDIFHEIVGHCPMLVDQRIADLTAAFGRWGREADHAFQVSLARLYWFTVEFGLVKTPDGPRAWGGGILSSPAETRYCLGAVPERLPFDRLTVLRTPYRIDILQPRYFCVESLDGLEDMLGQDLPDLMAVARRLGLFDRTFLSEPRPEAGREVDDGWH